jgi:hypothetical protein
VIDMKVGFASGEEFNLSSPSNKPSPQSTIARWNRPQALFGLAERQPVSHRCRNAMEFSE